jgi:hypothetical protein
MKSPATPDFEQFAAFVAYTKNHEEEMAIVTAS